MDQVSEGKSNQTSAETRARALIVHLDSLLEGAEVAARLVACGKAAVQPLREFLIEGRPRGVFQPRLWAVQALGGLGAEEVLIDYLRRPIASDDAVVRFAEQTVRSAAAKALAGTDRPDARQVVFEVARHERLPGALEALAICDPDVATPILIDALEDDFARDAAQAALRRYGTEARETLIDAAIDPGDRPQAALRRRRCALDLLREIHLEDDDWQRLEPLLDDADPEIVCATALLGVERSRDPGRIVRRLLEVLPDVSWEWLSTLEDIVVRCAVRAGDDFRPLLPLEGSSPHRPHVLSSWRRICRRLGIHVEGR